MKYLFVCAHPDDLEFSCGNLLYYLTQHGKEVAILSLSRGEFGIFEPIWKGPRLAKIRSQELKRASKINGIEKKHVHFGGIIDGFIRFTKENVNLVITWINKLNPDIIFAPEPYFTYYWHEDHISTGKILYYISTKLQNRLNNKIRSLYYYTTAKGNFSWPFNSAEHSFKALYEHKSQMWLLKWAKLFYPLEKHNFKKQKLGNWKMVEIYRRVSFYGKQPKANTIVRGILGLISQLNIINPPDSHFILPDMKTEFGQKVKKLRARYKFKD
ncbi:PIG-L deacetylase family protein [Promethearchaeum syntrophicum]|uniref:PIG-L deacetylase family protein n=1 Tax=Promethearchaeum syntrophicum TaxID=2594042 RepID=A0A5B9DF84_9ARCH|nr:PIG-L family deacetylase [Candidatus Prometheoarchaeum syntrophicum]QEE17938.1 Diacetylchitobiose deacetylase [Candidatus Prometheoarchaeum syntrophicum]